MSGGAAAGAAVAVPKTVVLDDDPTGTQSASGVRVLLRWDADLLTSTLREVDAVYLQTNSRAVDQATAVARSRRIRAEVEAASTALGGPVQVVLRGDSTLRGHVFAETDVFTTDDSPVLFVPAFPAGGRTTVGGVHYVRTAAGPVPAHETEYAADPVFPFRHSDLAGYVRDLGWREAFPVPLEEIRSSQGDAVAAALLAAPGRGVVIPDAETDEDIDLIHRGLRAAQLRGRPVVVRSAAPLAARCAGAASRGLLSPPLAEERGPVLVVCGSHTSGATAQLAELERRHRLARLTIDTEAALSDSTAAGLAVVPGARTALASDGIVVVSSERIRRAQHHTLAHGEAVMAALTTAVRALADDVRVVVAKGGITSAEVASTGLGAASATVRGQVLPGVSVWDLHVDSGATTYVVVPGNVGEPGALVDVVDRV
ncbi:four-carbon acid sugar kinase family protein [Micromonospora sp. NPDC007271]|uniref:four-carbon acid sugar kinase family protein n=1 Tax=Micromonospora sp. NPDC007271 TaxID=3154587 RepID=UPI003406F647